MYYYYVIGNNQQINQQTNFIFVEFTKKDIPVCKLLMCDDYFSTKQRE